MGDNIIEELASRNILKDHVGLHALLVVDDLLELDNVRVFQSEQDLTFTLDLHLLAVGFHVLAADDLHGHLE